MPFWDVKVREHYFDGMHISSFNINIHEHIRTGYQRAGPLPGMGFVKRGSLTTTVYSGGGPRRFTAGQHNVFMNLLHGHKHRNARAAKLLKYC